MLVPSSRPFFVSPPIMNTLLESTIILLFIWFGSTSTGATCPGLACYVVVNIDRSLFMKLYCVHFANAILPRGLVFKQPSKHMQKKPVCPWNLWFSIARHVRWLFYTQLGSCWTRVCLQSEFSLFSCCESFLLRYS